MKIDINQATVDFMKQCPLIDRFYFAFGEIIDDSQLFVPIPEKPHAKIYVDGTKYKYYSFALINYLPFTENPMPIPEGYSCENLDSMLDVQMIADWVEECESNKTRPDYGSGRCVQRISVLENVPRISGQNTDIRLAKYMIQIRVEFTER